MTQMSKKLHVSNVDQSIHFYRELLGLTLLYREDFPDQRSTSACLVNKKQPNAELLILDQKWGNLQSMPIDDRQCIDVNVDDPLSICQQTKYAGGEVVMQPDCFLNKPMAFIKDPDGYIVKMSQH